MPQHYASNAKSATEKKERPKLEAVVTGKVTTAKKPLGRKIKDLVVQADLKGVGRYLVADVLFPAARNMVVDAATEGIYRVVYGESRGPRRHAGSPGTKISYSQAGSSRVAPSAQFRGRSSAMTRSAPVGSEEYIVGTRMEADAILSRMHDVIEEYGIVSLGDLKELLELPSSHIEQKWGWDSLMGARVKQVREGYLIDLPPMVGLSA